MNKNEPIVYNKDADAFDCLCKLIMDQNDVLQNTNNLLKELCESILNKQCGKKNRRDQDWIPLETDNNGDCLPPGAEYKDYEYVLVRVGEGNVNLRQVPRIAKYVWNSYIWTSVDGIIYNKVTMWKPIPGTEWDDVYSDLGTRIQRAYRYE